MQELLKKLFTRYYHDIYTYLFSLCRNASLAEDLTSEVFVEVVRCAVTFRGESDIKTWLFTIARRRWFAYLHRKKQESNTHAIMEFYDHLSPSLEDTCCDRAVAQRIYSLLNEEPERTRSIVFMRMEGYSFYEIGQKHGISENSARVIDFRAKAKIRTILQKEEFGNE